jgi:pimeloyl-ACP methyl ester carboxylesterase
MHQHDGEQTHGMQVVHDGPWQKPPLLLVHGSGASGASWNPMVPALADHHHVIRVDLPGCGQSPPARSYLVPDQAARVAALLDDLNLGPVVAAGHSSGGWVVTSLAEQRPDLVRSLALISSGPDLEAVRPQPLILRALLAPPLGRVLWTVRSDATTRKMISALCARPVDVPDGWIADMRRTTYRTFRAVLHCNGAYLAQRSVPERLAALQVPIPILVIFGAADPRYEPSSAHRYEALPTARVEMLPGVGHLPILERSGTTSELLLGFAAAAR